MYLLNVINYKNTYNSFLINRNRQQRETNISLRFYSINHNEWKRSVPTREDV